MELWDAYDKYFNKIDNVTLIRGEVVPEGMYHLVSEIIVKHIDGTYLIMQRDFNKHFGGMWELTSGGSALKGETSLDCAFRELKEETGIVPTHLKEMKRIVHDIHRTLYVEYVCITDCDKNGVTLQVGETINFKWVSRDELLNMSENELASQRPLQVLKEFDI